MSSSNKRTKQARPLYAENRRKQIRLEKEKSPRSDEKELIQYFQEIELEQKEHLESLYPAIYEFIKRKAPSLAWKNMHMSFFGHISSKSI